MLFYIIFIQAFIHLSIPWCHDTGVAIALVFPKLTPKSSFWQQMAKSRETTCAKELPSVSFDEDELAKFGNAWAAKGEVGL